MIEYIIKVPTSIMEEVKAFWYVGHINREYCLKMLVSDEDIEFPECKVIIRDPIEEKEILTHHFLEKGFIKYKTDNINSIDESTDACIIDVLIEYPHRPEGYLYVDAEIIEIQAYTIKNLRINDIKKKNLFDIIDHFLNGKYKSCINEISIFGEYIAREFAKKLKGKIFTDFGSAVEALSRHKMRKRGKINYTFIGALLWPLYYIRNQKLHPYSKLEFNESLCITLLSNLSEIIKYLSQNQFKF